MSVVLRLAFSYKFLVVQFYKVEMKIRPRVLHSYADKMKAQKKAKRRPAVKSEIGGGGSQQRTIRK